MDGDSWHCTGGGDQDHPQENESKKAKWLSEEALQIAEKRREAKGKGEKKRYTHLNAEFQRIARRDKKAFFSDQWKEIEENNRMGKTRDLFKKIRDTKGTVRTGRGKTEWFQIGKEVWQNKGQIIWTDLQKQKILKRGHSNKQENYTKKIFMTQITMMV